MKYNNQNNLQTIRKKLGLKQIKVAMDLGTTQETISSYETGRVFPNIDMLIALAKYYNTSIDYLLGLTKYDIPTNDIKPNNITDDDFMLLTKIVNDKIRMYKKGNIRMYNIVHENTSKRRLLKK